MTSFPAAIRPPDSLRFEREKLIGRLLPRISSWPAARRRFTGRTYDRTVIPCSTRERSCSRGRSTYESEPPLDADLGRIAASKMLLENFSPMIGAVPPNWFGGHYGGKDQHGRAARSGVGGDRALPIGRKGGEGTHPRRAVRDDGLASQACGARTPAARDGWAGRGRGTARAQA